MKNRPLVVVGLDGASFKLLTPWIEKGELPNLKKIIENGVCGELESIVPTITCPAWQCYATGKNPGKLGVYFWVDVDWSEQKIVPHTSASFKSKQLWHYLNKSNLKTGVINMPTTYPPQQIDGFIITSFWTPRKAIYTYPEDLQRELEKKYNYRIMPSTISHKRKKETSDSIKELIKIRFKVLKDKIIENKYDFLHLSIFYINSLHHFYWDDNVVKETWQIIDENLGWIIQKGVNLMIMSDHGGDLTPNVFYINRWLENKGYLRRKRRPVNFVRKYINREAIVEIANKLHISKIAQLLVPKSIKSKLPPRKLSAQTKGFEQMIDWHNTLAIGLHEGPIYINKHYFKNIASYNNFTNKLVSELDNVTFNGEKLLKKIYRKEELYSGQYVDKAPDIVLLANDGYCISGNYSKRLLTNANLEANKWKAKNDLMGIFLAYGHDFRESYEINDIKILDLAPTILHLMGVPVSEDMDGKVLKDIFKKDSKPYNSKVKYQKPLDESIVEDTLVNEEDIKKKLKELGYIS